MYYLDENIKDLVRIFDLYIPDELPRLGMRTNF